jgi:hypothetical protein
MRPPGVGSPGQALSRPPGPPRAKSPTGKKPPGKGGGGVKIKPSKVAVS